MTNNFIHNQLSNNWFDLLMHRKYIIYINDIQINDNKTIIKILIIDMSGMNVLDNKYSNNYDKYSNNMSEYQYYLAYSRTVVISIPYTDVDIDLYDIILPISSKLIIYKPSREERLGYKVTIFDTTPDIKFMNIPYNFIHNNTNNIIDNAINAYGIISLFSNNNLRNYHITRNDIIDLSVEHPHLNEIDYV